MRRYTRNATKINSGRLLAPRTTFGIRLRNGLFSASSLVRPIMALNERLATDTRLKDYRLDPSGDAALPI